MAPETGGFLPGFGKPPGSLLVDFVLPHLDLRSDTIEFPHNCRKFWRLVGRNRERKFSSVDGGCQI